MDMNVDIDTDVDRGYCTAGQSFVAVCFDSIGFESCAVDICASLAYMQATKYN